MRSIFLPLLTSVTLGCAATQVPPAASVAHSGQEELAGLQNRSDAQARRITELEARLGMLEAESREMRALVQQREAARPDVIRIGAERSSPVDADEVSSMAQAPATPVRDRRPLLRSIGEPVAAARAPVVLPVAPPGVPDRLPVVPLPNVSAQVSNTVPAQTIEARAMLDYRAALTLVRNRDFDAALTALTEFLSKYPEQEFTDRAMFWRAEAFYAKRDYERAMAEFEALSARFPRSEKAADAILKIGLCHQRLGDEQRAQVFFRRVRETFPESAAARAASKEGA